MAEHIMQHKGNERTKDRVCKHSIRHIAHTLEACSKQNRSKHTIARAETIHAIDKINRVYNTYARHERKGNGNSMRQFVYAPQAVEIVDIDTTQKHHQTDGKYLQTKAQARREVQNIITYARIEHNKHSDDKLELDTHLGDIVSSNTEAEHQTDEYSHTTQHRNGHFV